MRFSEQPKSNTIQFRVTPDEHAYLGRVAEQNDTTVAGVIRKALDAWLAAQTSSRSGSSDSGSRATPSGERANVRAASKRSPSRNHGRTQ